MDLRRRTVSIIGLGASGAAAARLSAAHGGRTYVSDLRTDASVAARRTDLVGLGVDVDLGRHDVDRIAASDVVVVSPGIPPDVQVLAALRARGVSWSSEPDFAVHFFRAPLIAVTGTNGKTTTAALTAHLLTESGVRVGLGGNIGADFGPPASDLALMDPVPDWFVLELSSFQLGDSRHVSPQVGVLTNLAPDHLDRYASVDDYYADKARLFQNADATSQWVLPRQPEVAAMTAAVPGRQWSFDLAESTPPCAYVDAEHLILDEGEPVRLVPRSEFPLLGGHNVLNALAAALAARAAGASVEGLRAGLRTFAPLPHRLETVSDRDGLRWVNDSKATNVAASRSAILSLDGTLVVLLGGVDKGEDFRPLAAALEGRARAVVVYGAVAPRLEEELQALQGLTRCDGSFEDAVAMARGLASPGDTVLLSPATSSYDMFDNYQVRGRRFRELARGMD